METVAEQIKATILAYCVNTQGDNRPAIAHATTIMVGDDEWFTGLAEKIDYDLNHTNLLAQYEEMEQRVRPGLEDKVTALEARIEELSTLAEGLAEDNANLRNTVAGFQAKKKD